MRLFVASMLALLSALGAAPAGAADLLSESQARAKAVQILLGEPYGKTPADVARNLKESSLITAGSAEPCGRVNKPVWRIHVLVQNPTIDGYLVLDARTGRIVCAGLPFLS